MSILLILLLSLFLFYYFQAPVHHDKFLVLGKKVNFNYESNSDWGIALKTECKLAGKCEERGLYLEKSYIPHQREVCHFHWKTELGYFDKGYKVKKPSNVCNMHL